MNKPTRINLSKDRLELGDLVEGALCGEDFRGVVYSIVANGLVKVQTTAWTYGEKFGTRKIVVLKHGDSLSLRRKDRVFRLGRVGVDPSEITEIDTDYVYRTVAQAVVERGMLAMGEEADRFWL